MAQVLLSKPSKLNNLGHILLGYYLSSLVFLERSLPLEQQILYTIALGSFIGTLIFYIKPIERIISFSLMVSKNNSNVPSEPYGEFQTPVLKSEVLYSDFLANERSTINSILFMALGIVFSYNYLESIGLSEYFLPFQTFSIVLFLIAVWEIKELIKDKIPIVVYFYNYFNISKFTKDLETAIRNKDWIRAYKITDKEPELDDPELFYTGRPIAKYGICKNCNKIQESRHCSICGTALVKNCSHCQAILVEDSNGILPNFCKSCGTKI